MRVFRVLVISDIHADENAAADTYALTEPPTGRPGFHPISDLLRFIDKSEIRCDAVLCPGDITNQSNSAGKIYGWAQLNQIAGRSEASLLMATPGNHDVETRTSGVDPCRDLKNLVPSFPSRDAGRDSDFWDRGFSLFEADEFRILNLNTCHGFPVHPGSSATDEEMARYFATLNRGVFDATVESALEGTLEDLDFKPVNILLCHHHPVEHQLVAEFQDSYGPIDDGNRILRLLDQYPASGRWMIVHGHKHVPLLTEGGFSANAPVLLCAASAGGKLWHPIVSVTHNQFHIVEFELDHIDGLPPLRGTIASYVWGFGRGWYPPDRSGGLPGECGFGVRHDHRTLAAKVAGLLSNSALHFTSWQSVQEAVPEVKYQGPRDIEQFESALKERGIVLMRDGHTSRIAQVAREVS